MGKLKVLFLGARPREAATLRLKEEIHKVTYRLGKAGFGDRVEYVDEWAVQFSDLPGLLLKHRPQIVHFSGHGTAREDLIFEDDLGQTHPVPREAMIAMFRVGALQRAVRCVVLNACYSSSVAAGIAESIDFVIGSGAAITDAAAIAFTEAFYQVLAHGETIEDAFEVAQAQFLAVSKPGAALPTLIVRQGADPRQPLLPGEDSRVKAPSAPDVAQPPCFTVSPPLIFLHQASGSRADRALCQELIIWLSPLRMRGVLDYWDLTQIRAGEVRARAIESNLERADLVLLLVSADSLADSEWSTITQRVMQLREIRNTRVIPVLLRPAFLSGVPFEGLAFLPANGKAISSTLDREAVWGQVVSGITQTLGASTPFTHQSTKRAAAVAMLQPSGLHRLPTRASVRRLMGAVLVSQVDVETFCSDHFFAVKRQYFQPQMDRLRMETILLDYVSPAEVLGRLTEDYPEAVRQHAHLLRYE